MQRHFVVRGESVMPFLLYVEYRTHTQIKECISVLTASCPGLHEERRYGLGKKTPHLSHTHVVLATLLCTSRMYFSTRVFCNTKYLHPASATKNAHCFERENGVCVLKRYYFRPLQKQRMHSVDFNAHRWSPCVASRRCCS